MEKIIIASNNKGKIKEIQDIFKEFKIISIKELNIEYEIVEDGKTFLENAIKKAEELAKKLNGKWCLADDSGIMIDYLDGFPGIHTKRWFNGTDRERNLEIIKKLKDVQKENRRVHFISAVAISNGSYTIYETAEIKGYVSEKPRGKNGFGFDEIFELDDGKTLAEIEISKKNELSARKKALEKLKIKMKEELL